MPKNSFTLTANTGVKKYYIKKKSSRDIGQHLAKESDFFRKEY